MKDKEIKVEEKPVTKDVAFFSNTEDLELNCLQSKKLCVIGLLDGRTNQDSIKSFDNGMKVLDKLLIDDKTKPFTFGWVNATCQNEFITKMNTNAESLPNIVVYIPHKELYANLIGTFDYENILFFLENTLRGRVPLNNLTKKELTLKDIKCEDIKERVQENLEDDEILREIIEEERRKREEFEKERENSKKNKKKKKKNEL